MGRREEFKLFMDGRLGDGNTMDGVIRRLEELDYFEAPASINHHGRYSGGLYDHSYEVAVQLLDLTERLDLKWDSVISDSEILLFYSTALLVQNPTRSLACSPRLSALARQLMNGAVAVWLFHLYSSPNLSLIEIICTFRFYEMAHIFSYFTVNSTFVDGIKLTELSENIISKQANTCCKCLAYSL